jgi:hypothetical protein
VSRMRDLFDIAEACELIEEFVAGKSFEDYTRDRMLLFALGVR